MAFTKEIIAPNRALTKYQRITKVEVNAFTSSVVFTIALYADAEGRELNMPIWQDTVTIPMDAFVNDFSAIGYKILNEYKGTVYTDAPSDGAAPESTEIALVKQTEATPEEPPAERRPKPKGKSTAR